MKVSCLILNTISCASDFQGHKSITPFSSVAGFGTFPATASQPRANAATFPRWFLPASAGFLFLALAAPAPAHIWDRVVWNDMEMEIQIIPTPLDAFYAKTPFFDNAIALLAPSVVPIRYGNTYATTPARRTALWTPVAYCDCGGTSYTPPAPPVTPAPVPLPASGWLMLAGLALLRILRGRIDG